MNRAKRRVAVITVVLALLLVGDAHSRDVQRTHVKETAPVRLVSLDQTGDSVLLRLENGQVLSVDQRRVRIRDRAAREDRSNRRERLTANKGRPAAVSVVLKRNGDIKRVQIDYFRSEADVNAFVKAGNTGPNHQ